MIQAIIPIFQQDMPIRHGSPVAIPDRPTVIWFHNTATTSPETLEKALRNTIVTHAWILASSYRDLPINDAIFQARKIRDICSDHKVKMIWSRCLWPNYKVKEFKYDNFFQPDYYIQFIEQIKTESNMIQSDYIGIDMEPYAKFPFKTIKRVCLPDNEYNSIKDAIITAVATAGKVDFIMPSSGWCPTHLYNALATLAETTVAGHTRYNRPLTNGSTDRPFDIFCAYINTEKSTLNGGSGPYFTIHEIIYEKRHLWQNCKGLMLYPLENNILDIVNEASSSIK